MREEGRDQGVGGGPPWGCPDNARGLQEARGGLRASASFRGSPLVSEQSPDTLGWLDPTDLSHCLSQPSILHACHSDALCFTWNHSWDTRCLRYSVFVVVSFPQPGKPTPPHFKPWCGFSNLNGINYELVQISIQKSTEIVYQKRIFSSSSFKRGWRL